MIRSLWSAASGMIAQQTNVDTIANNLANVNTTGYKEESVEFKSLLYQTLQTATTSANGEAKPISAQVGLGVRNSAITSQFIQGAFTASDSNTSLAIDGNGFFAVQLSEGNIRYTRNGEFVLALNEDNTLTLTTTDGLPVMSTDGTVIKLDAGMISNKVTIGEDGTLYYPNDDGEPVATDFQIGLYQFNNPKGLQKVGSSLYAATAASGAALNEDTNDDLNPSSLAVGYLEASNVQIATEMVNLIIAQRAYESNSKAITTSDDMMQVANQLKS
ncbi:flagellar hook-basal body protein [Lachnospiraceae bacterium C1.1]|nr:flagellar hook-basal body protein [Lachnospiraceae bacterium C1.1]